MSPADSYRKADDTIVQPKRQEASLATIEVLARSDASTYHPNNLFILINLTVAVFQITKQPTISFMMTPPQQNNI